MSHGHRQATKIHLERSEGAARIRSTVPLPLKYVEEARFAVHAALHIALKHRTRRLPVRAAGLARRAQLLQCLAVVSSFPRNEAAKKPGIDGVRIHLASVSEIYIRGGKVFHGE